MTTASPACSVATGAPQLDLPAAPSNCQARTYTYRDRRKGNFSYTVVSWRDNSSDEDGFTVEVWRRNQSRVWVLAGTVNLASNTTSVLMYDAGVVRYRVKAFNASGSSDWSNWAR
jgi:hypothetical protein